MKKLIMVTGFPGFICERLYRGLIEDDPATNFILLVHPTQVEKAQHLTDKDERVTILPGDITQENLGMSEADKISLQDKVTHFFHLAAIYDLAVPQDLAYQVNVIGTQNVNRFVRTLRSLQRYVYFSTAYVSGTRTGRILEGELDKGQTFKNHYEETKFEAEKRVAAMKGVPTTIIRPGVVVGDSKTGETIKFDGPYFMLRFLDHFSFGPVPYIGKGDEPLDVVPIDFIIRATIYLAKSEQGIGTFHLTGGATYPSQEIYKIFSRELLGKEPSFYCPLGIAQTLLKIGPLRRYLGLDPEAVAYVYHPSVYDSTQASNVLKDGGIHCPDLIEYIPNMVRFFKEHRNDPAMRVQVR
ncbi:SDR family oxidoreductase [Marininema halotolerans]|uniref:Male sterility protein n=1 Tax=Marininema halotolerans TaxID=1155944 RepID=A0A1I6RK72_9BACL|nr:SDR family oxidoreductase [Marininema halotolerans]SFS64878.1 Male sterility protein [Marininema halotolerans]